MNSGGNRELIAAINDNRPVSGLSHTLYKYPGRFSPRFARQVIVQMTRPGDVVLDPFVGGGTSLVEAMAAGRDGIGLDVNELAVFVTKVKTRLFTDAELRRVSNRMDALSSETLNAHSHSTTPQSNCSMNLGDRHAWRLRNFLGMYLQRIDKFRVTRGSGLVRSILLRTAQWALDCRKVIPTLEQFRERLKVETREAIWGAQRFRESVFNTNPQRRPRSLCLVRSAIGSEYDLRLKHFGRPSLVITSPPYPGVHVLYHRWQVNGRRETAAPYWIANLSDGHYASYYTFADRSRKDISKYLETAGQAFASVRRLVARGTPLAQMVSFADPDDQLEPYLHMLAAAGWSEIKRPRKDTRLSRKVPGRKWYTSIIGCKGNRELVLFHRAC